MSEGFKFLSFCGGFLDRMDIKAYFTCKKPRRSNRLIVKEVEEKKVQAITQSPLGYFDILPIELKFCVLGYLSIDDLSLLTITSKSMRNLVECYRVSMFHTREVIVHSRAHGVLDVENQAEWLQRYKKLGLLMKRSTCLYATKERLKIVNDFLTRMMCANTENCKDQTRCVAQLCFGKFLHTMIAGWDDSECQRAFDAICQHTFILKNMKIVVSSKPGAHPCLEYDVRCFLRRVFLDACSNVADKAFWLTRILKPWPLVQQARLLYLLYGAAHNEEVLWYQMCGSSVDVTHLAHYFGGLACAMQTLYAQSNEWSEDDLISILDEMTSCPEEWVAENVAALLLACGDALTSKMLVSKAINGRVLELSSIITSFCLVSVKNSCGLSHVLGLVQSVLQAMDNTRDRIFFLNGLMDMFKELILDLHGFADSDEDGNEEKLYFLVTAFAEFSKRIIHLAFKTML
ncbi:F-box only protein 47-like isoform X2 [Pomacea canaliculata]|uniref:F-box only protein 47-like isoform X2 n=1 Tax=Pomacea canaliculata TaxID=400727 RepID=UPI000D73B8B8|nr:F-box only protein 47-like isoform X2 [Pomacea canaliculata]